MLVAAAVVPTPPLLVPAVAGRSAGQDDGLRTACRAAVTVLVAAGPDVVVAVGAAGRTGPAEGRWDFTGFGVDARAEPGPALPLALGVGDWLLDDVGWRGRRRCVGVDPSTPAEQCAELGRSLADEGERVALLVCGDGSARRTEKAPGYLDERAAGFDAAAARALGAADPEALLRLDAELAGELLAAGRAAWQVLAGAAREGGAWRGELLHDDAPYGVGYLVATWLPG